MINYPLTFESETSALAGVNGTWTSQSQEHFSKCSVPQEFMGSGGALSPEDLFNHALTNCFVATFKVYAENSKLGFSRVIAKSRLVVEPGEDRKPIMKSIHIHVKILNPTNIEKALLLAQKASQGGFILNSVKTERHFTFETVETEEVI